MKTSAYLACAAALLAAGCAGAMTATQPAQPAQAPSILTKKFTVHGFGPALAVTMVQITVPTLPSSGGVTVTSDGAVWWSSLVGVDSGQMVRLSSGFSLKAVPVNAPSSAGALPDRSMSATPNGFAWGTFQGVDPTHGFGFLEIVAAAPGSAITSPPADLPAGLPGLALKATPFIATGPDGNTWYVTQPGAPRGVLEPGGIGDVSEVTGENFFQPTPSVSDYLTAVSPGPDRVLWAGGNIDGGLHMGFYRYSTARHLIGSIVILARVREIDAEVTGPDHALWFTDAADNVIGRVTVSGALSTFPVPTVGARPLDITVGGDGALWYTENGAGRVGRITTSGSQTEYPLPPGDTSPVQIAGPATSPGCGRTQLWVAANGNIVELIVTV